MRDIGQSYNFKEAEPRIYAEWEKSGFFNPDNLPRTHKKPFTIMMPPPNANGPLHIGHAVFVTLQDIMIRYARMNGRRALWLPGADHAGFETQVVYDKKLDKEGRGSVRFSAQGEPASGMAREELWKEIWDFTQQNKKVMEEQLRMLGASCDWSRETFTLDPDIIKIVYETFKKLYEDGFVYRGERIVNWCSKHQTSLSDLENKFEDQEGAFYYLQYGPFVIGTARPETKFGDKYVVMHPGDKRYKHYKEGQTIDLEWINGPITATVVKDTSVDMKFGTGVMTITPWHDVADFEIAERHNLTKEQIIDFRGKLLPIADEFAGMKIAEARPKIVEKLKAKGLLVKIDERYMHSVRLCYKCNTPIEPQIRPQWFIKTKPLADLAVKALKQKKISIIPKRSEKVYLHWLKNIRDWNISRQIVWGIRIPAWFRSLSKTEKEWDLNIYDGKEIFEGLKNGKKRFETRAGKPRGAEKDWRDFKVGDVIRFSLIKEGSEKKLSNEIITKEIVAVEHFAGIDELLAKHDVNEIHPYHPGEYRDWWESRPQLKERIEKYGIWAFELTDVNKTEEVSVGEKAPVGEGWVQDPDVFDTWFSSGQWPYATLMAQDAKRREVKSSKLKVKSDFETYYPTDVMETGYDILFFWVIRMVMLGLYRTKKVPFKTVYLHGLVRDKDRQKMSKSKGNVVDPLAMVDMYGGDALRMALVIGNTAGNDIVISEDKIRGYRNFATKIWNISRFVLMNYDETNKEKLKYSASDRKNLAELEKVKKSVAKDIEAFKFHHAGEKAYHYVWHTFADKIIESAKPRLTSSHEGDKKAAQSMLIEVLCGSLKILHPFMPFITEEIWGKLPNRKNLLIIEPW